MFIILEGVPFHAAGSPIQQQDIPLRRDRPNCADPRVEAEERHRSGALMG